MPDSRRPWLSAVLALCGAGLLLSLGAPSGGALLPERVTRIADPKLDGGGVEVSFRLDPPGTMERVIVEALDGGLVVRTVADEFMTGATEPIEVYWDGLDEQGDFLDTGSYEVRVRLAGGGSQFVEPVDLVRLGVTEIEAQPPGGEAGADDGEYQMVYFKKNGAIEYYVTPTVHEYRCVAPNGEVSDLDHDDGAPRAAVAPHTALDEPVMNGAVYEGRQFNYPLCYLAGSSPRFELTFGASSTTALGAPQGVGYPVAGVELRARLSDSAGEWTAVTDAVAPAGTATFLGPALSSGLALEERKLFQQYEYSTDGGAQWWPVPGSFATSHRFYTLIGQPNFTDSESGQRYAGPWVEVADYVARWGASIGGATDTQAGVVVAVIQGFFGKFRTVPTSIEGVIYDAYPQGGDGGANHYFINSQHRMRLSSLLDGHASGVYVNCSDCAGATSTMMAMTGVDDVQLVHLGGMQLKAIWGIGTSGYTTNLWGSGSHGFSYHKIVTREAGVTVSDACMSLDEDGSPNTTPGTPGYNCDRPWAGQPYGYDFLSSYNSVSKYLQALPKLY